MLRNYALFLLEQLTLDSLPPLRRLFVWVGSCNIECIAGYENKTTKFITDKKTNLLTWIFIASCLIYTPTITFANHLKTPCLPALKPDLNNDGIVDYKEIWLVGRGYKQPTTDYRYEKMADIDCDNQIDDFDWNYVWSVYGKSYPIFPEVSSVIELLGDNTTYAGKEAKIMARIILKSDKMSFNAKIKTTIKPNNRSILNENISNQTIFAEKGKPLFSWSGREEFSKQAYFSNEFPISFIPNKSGKYQITTQIEILESGRIFQESKLFTVLPEVKTQIIAPLSYFQYNCFKDTIKSYLYVYSKITGENLVDIEKVEVIEKESGKFYPLYGRDTLSPPYKKNISAKDTYLGGRALISPEFIKNKQCKSGYLKIQSPYHTTVSKTVEFCASSVESSKSFFVNKQLTKNPSTIKNRGIHQCDEILSINVNNETSKQTLEVILDKLEGEIIAYQANIDVYFVTPKPPFSKEKQKKLFTELKKLNNIRFIYERWGNDQSRVDGMYKLE